MNDKNTALEPALVGRVAAINRYPVKSMCGEALSTARIGWSGLEGDRRYAFVRGSYRGSFPWLTARELPRLLHYRPAFADPSDPAKSRVYVTPPEGEALPIEDEGLREALAALAGEPLHLLHLGRGAYDCDAVSLLSTAAVASLSAAAGRELEPTRFRPNLLIAAEGDRPYPEDGWIGQLLVVGERPDSARLRVVRPIQRCVMINIDPDSTERDPQVLRGVVQAHAGDAGVYAVVERPGSIAVGDPLLVCE